MKIKRSCPSNKSWVEKKGVKNGGFCRVLPGKKRSFVAPIGKTAPKMRQVALNSPQEPATDYRGELLSVGITSAVLGALGGSVAAAMLLTPKGSDEAFRSGQQEAALKFEREKAELESKYQEEADKLKKAAGIDPQAQQEIDRLKRENEALKNQAPAVDPKVKEENDRLIQELADKETIAKQSEEKLAALTQEHEDLKRSSDEANEKLRKVTEEFNQLQESSKTAAPDPELQKQLDELSQQVSSLSATAEDRRVALENKESEYTHLQEQHEAIVQELERHRAIVATYEGTIATHEGTIATHEGTIADLQSQQQKATTEFASLIQEHQRTIAAQANAIKTHEETIAQLKQHIEDLDSQLGNASSENISIATQRAKAASDLDQANIDIIEATAALDKANEELDSMKKKAQDLTRQLGAIHQQHKSEIEKVKSATSAEVSTELNKRISELERAMTIARTEVEEELYPVDSSSKVVTQHYAKATRENLGGIQLGLTIRRNNVALDDIPKEKFVNGVSVATQGLVAPLKEQVLISGSTEGDSLLAEWEKKTVELVDSLKSGAIGTDEFWQQQALAHHQHIRRRDFFLKEVKKIESDHVTEARKIASDFHEAYLAASPEKRDKIIESYGRKFRQQYKEMKSSIFGLQIAIRSNPNFQLDGVHDEEGTIMAIETRDEMKKALGHNEYLLSLLGKKKKR